MSDEHYAERLERGKKFSAWLRRITTNKVTRLPGKAAEIARVTGISPSWAGLLLRDCKDHTGLISLPTEETIDRIAEKYNANADEGKAIVGILSKEGLKDVFVPEPGSTKHKTSSGWTIFAPPGARSVRRRINIIEAYLRGQDDQDLGGIEDGEEAAE